MLISKKKFNVNRFWLIQFEGGGFHLSFLIYFFLPIQLRSYYWRLEGHHCNFIIIYPESLFYKEDNKFIIGFPMQEYNFELW